MPRISKDSLGTGSGTHVLQNELHFIMEVVSKELMEDLHTKIRSVTADVLASHLGYKCVERLSKQIVSGQSHTSRPTTPCEHSSIVGLGAPPPSLPAEHKIQEPPACPPTQRPLLMHPLLNYDYPVSFSGQEVTQEHIVKRQILAGTKITTWGDQGSGSTEAARPSEQSFTANDGNKVMRLSEVDRRWASLVKSVLWYGGNTEFHNLPLRPFWSLKHVDDLDFRVSRSTVQSPYSYPHPGGTLDLSSRFQVVGTEPNVVGASHLGGCDFVQPLIRHPASKANRAYALLSVFVILYDLMMLPLMVFETDDDGIVSAFTVATTIFWSLDIIMTCLSGYYTTEATIEMRPHKIMYHYLQTWFAFDFCVTTIDWIVLTSSFNSNFFRLTKALKASRILRALRVIRVVKAARSLHGMMFFFSSEITLVATKVLSMIILILIINHYIGCAWFALAYWNKDDTRTWLKAHDAEDASASMGYLMSLHWSLTQFTPATNNINPQNERERLFAIFTVLFALIMFTNFLGRLTNALGEIQKLNAASNVEQKCIRQFFVNRNVSLTTANHVWHFYRTYFKKPKTTMLMSDVPFFKELPAIARSELYKDIYAPSLLQFPVFSELGKWGWSFLQAICSTALTEMLFNVGAEIFDKGDHAGHVYQSISGAVSYDFVAGEFASAIFSRSRSAIFERKVQLQSPTIISEVALWCDWQHCGTLAAANPCHMIRISNSHFEKIVQQKIDRTSFAFRALVTYAVKFTQHVIDSYETGDPVTDVILHGQTLDPRQLASYAFKVGGEPQFRSRLSRMRDSKRPSLQLSFLATSQDEVGVKPSKGLLKQLSETSSPCGTPTRSRAGSPTREGRTATV